MGQPARILRRLLPWLSAAVAVAVLYDGWIFYERWHSLRQIERRRAAQEARQAQQTLDLLGRGGLKILSFYAVPQTIHRGDRTELCFGVTGAKRVRMEPVTEALHPALSYCLPVAPRKDTQYQLIAEDSAGQTVSSSVLVKVQR
jgi:hypothetical protein